MIATTRHTSADYKTTTITDSSLAITSIKSVSTYQSIQGPKSICEANQMVITRIFLFLAKGSHLWCKPSHDLMDFFR